MSAVASNSVPELQFSKVMAAETAASLIKDGDTVAVTGAGGGMLEPDTVFAAVETRFLAGNGPWGLGFVYALGFGDCDRKGTNRFAHEGLVKRVIGGHWGWSPRMRDLVRQEKIEAYSLPSGAISQLFREIGAGRPGLHTHVGLGTFVDPRLQGGRMNASAKDELTELVEIDGKPYLRYKPFKVDVAIIRGSMADPDGNVSLDQEAGNLDVFALAWRLTIAAARLSCRSEHWLSAATCQRAVFMYRLRSSMLWSLILPRRRTMRRFTILQFRGNAVSSLRPNHSHLESGNSLLAALRRNSGKALLSTSDSACRTASPS